MADPPLNSDPRVRADRRSIPSTPRWVKVFAIITVIVLVVLFVIQHLGALGDMGGPHMGGHN
jgi:hypothetical protein